MSHILPGRAVAVIAACLCGVAPLSTFTPVALADHEALCAAGGEDWGQALRDHEAVPAQ